MQQKCQGCYCRCFRLLLFPVQVSKGKNPVWKEAVRGVRIPAGVQYITINVWDEDPGKDDFMGTHRVWLEIVCMELQ